MSFAIFLLPVCVAALDWLAVARNNRRLEYFLKPGVMAALLVCLGLLGNKNANYDHVEIWIGVGLALSLVGDVFLMLPRERFIAGLVAFLLAHVAYVIGLNPTLPPLNVASLLVFALVALVAVQYYRRIAAGLSGRGLNRLKPPVMAYMIVIGLMVTSALLTLLRVGWPPLSAMLFSAGALLFLLSDILLAWDHFVGRLSFGRTPRMIAYHVGQILLTLGALTYFPHYLAI
jgi:uncharacterized membrane protein YhhN